MTALLAVVFGLSLPPSVKPWPIGAGPVFKLGPGPPPTVCSQSRTRYGVHLELFIRRQVLIIPAGVGVARPWRLSFGRIGSHGCTARVRTLDPTGTIEVAGRATLGDFFRVWGKALGPRRIAGFHSRQQLLAFVDGKRRRGDPRRIPLTRHTNIVLALGGYVPPHPRYLFPPGL